MQPNGMVTMFGLIHSLLIIYQPLMEPKLMEGAANRPGDRMTNT